MYRNPFDYFIIIITVWVAFGVIFFMMIQTDKISIEYNYQDELEQCELDLKNTQPICPDCKCSSSGGFSWFVVGLLWGAVLLSFIQDYLNKRKWKKKKKK